MATNTEILPMAGQTTFPVPFGHEAMAQCAPGVGMVPRRPGVMACDAVILPMAGEAGLLACAEVQTGCSAVELDPAALVGIGPGKGNLARGSWCVVL